MRFRVLYAALAVIGALAGFSCDKHQVGELPEIQKEHSDIGEHPESDSSSGKEMRPDSGKAPTPAEFFPEKSPSNSP